MAGEKKSGYHSGGGVRRPIRRVKRPTVKHSGMGGPGSKKTPTTGRRRLKAPTPIKRQPPRMIVDPKREPYRPIKPIVRVKRPPVGPIVDPKRPPRPRTGPTPKPKTPRPKRPPTRRPSRRPTGGMDAIRRGMRGRRRGFQR